MIENTVAELELIADEPGFPGPGVTVEAFNMLNVRLDVLRGYRLMLEFAVGAEDSENATSHYDPTAGSAA